VKDVLHKMTSVVMAILLLASTISWKVEKHFCMGHLVDVALFLDAEDCGMSMDMMYDDALKMQEDDSCCTEEVSFVDGQEELSISFDDLSIGQQTFILVYTYSYATIFEVLARQPVSNEYYPPPILVKDIQVLDQVFLI
jgi:hypothetical protein